MYLLLTPSQRESLANCAIDASRSHTYIHPIGSLHPSPLGKEEELYNF